MGTSAKKSLPECNNIYALSGSILDPIILRNKAVILIIIMEELISNI